MERMPVITSPFRGDTYTAQGNTLGMGIPKKGSPEGATHKHKNGCVAPTGLPF